MPSDNQKLIIAPDGGWGWMVVLSIIIHNVLAAPPMAFFAFLFKGVADELELSIFQVAIIITYNLAFSLTLGTIVQPWLDANNQRMRRRKVAIVGAVLTVISYVGISFAQEFYQMILLYSLLIALGMKLFIIANEVSIKQYFKKKYTLVQKISVISVAFGGIIMAPLMAYLLEQYQSRMTILITASITFSLLPAALFLRPPKSATEIKNIENELVQFVATQNHEAYKNKCNERNNNGDVQSLIQPGGIYIFIPQSLKPPLEKLNSEVEDLPPSTRNQYLDLLLNPTFLCIGSGMVLNTLAEGIFSALLPFMLFQFNFRPMSVGIGIACFVTSMTILKFTSLFFISQRECVSPRIASILSIVILIGARVAISLGLLNNFRNLLICAISIGSAKGFLLGVIEKVVTESIPARQEVYAVRLICWVSSFALLFVGPALGYLRDLTGSFQMTMFCINAMNCGVIVIWTLELLISVIVQLIRQRKTDRS